MTIGTLMAFSAVSAAVLAVAVEIVLSVRKRRARSASDAACWYLRPQGCPDPRDSRGRGEYSVAFYRWAEEYVKVEFPQDTAFQKTLLTCLFEAMSSGKYLDWKHYCSLRDRLVVLSFCDRETAGDLPF